MVQHFGYLKGGPSIGDILTPSLGQGLGQMFSSYQANKRLDSILNDPQYKNAETEEKLSALESGMRPFGEIGEQLFNRRAQLEQVAQKEIEKKQSKLEDQKNYDVIKSSFGKEAADLWSVSDQGAKTELVKKALEHKERGKNLSELLNDTQSQAPTLPQDEYAYDFSGRTLNQKFDQMNQLRKENIPILEKTQAKLRASELENFKINRLEQLSEEVPSSMIEQLVNLINPITGDFIVPKGASPAAQEYQKIIADFTKNIKESYGSVVSDLDLKTFLQSLPSLANSKEGRRQIFNYMRQVRAIEDDYNKGILEAFIKYSPEGISQEMLFKSVNDKLSKNNSIKELENLDSSIRQMAGLSSKQNQNIKVKSPDGTVGEIPKEDIDLALQEGYTLYE